MLLKTVVVQHRTREAGKGYMGIFVRCKFVNRHSKCQRDKSGPSFYQRREAQDKSLARPRNEYDLVVPFYLFEIPTKKHIKYDISRQVRAALADTP